MTVLILLVVVIVIALAVMAALVSRTRARRTEQNRAEAQERLVESNHARARAEALRDRASTLDPRLNEMAEGRHTGE